MTVEVSANYESSELAAHWNLYRNGNLVAVLGDATYVEAVETAITLAGGSGCFLAGYSVGYNFRRVWR